MLTIEVGGRASGRSRCRCPAASRPTTRWWPRRWPRRWGWRDALDRLPRLRGVRGRMELAARLPNGAAVYVDYAHTPDALERLLTALRPHTAGPAARGVRRRRRPRPRQAPADGRGRRAPRRRRDRHRRQSAQRGSRRDPRRGAGRLPGRARDRRPRAGDRGGAERRWRPAMCWRWPARATSRARRSATRCCRSTMSRVVRRPGGGLRVSGMTALWTAQRPGARPPAARLSRAVRRRAACRSTRAPCGRATCSSRCSAKAGDGHAFVADALAKGAAGAMVHQRRAGRRPRCCCVDDTLAGAARGWAAIARARFTGRLVAVTGSVGKTTTKEMLRTVLSAFGADACGGRVLQQPLGRAADAGAPAAGRRVLRRRDRHEPCRRDRAAGPPGAAACRGDHHDREGACRPSRLASRRSPTRRRDPAGLEPGGIAVLPADSPLLARLRAAAGRCARRRRSARRRAADVRLVEPRRGRRRQRCRRARSPGMRCASG